MYVALFVAYYNHCKKERKKEGKKKKERKIEGRKEGKERRPDGWMDERVNEQAKQ